MPSARVGGLHHAGPHLGEGVHVERHVVHLALVVGHGRVDVVVELCEAVHVVPHVTHGGVEDVRAVHVHVDAVDVLGVDVAGHVVATVDDQAGLAGAAGLVGKNRTGDAGANNEVIVLGHRCDSVSCACGHSARTWGCVGILSGACMLRVERVPAGPPFSLASAI